MFIQEIKKEGAKVRLLRRHCQGATTEKRLLWGERLPRSLFLVASIWLPFLLFFFLALDFFVVCPYLGLLRSFSIFLFAFLCALYFF